MATSLAIIILLGLCASKVFEKIKMPGLLGMLIVGIIIGPYGFNLLDSEIIKISGDIRKIALIIILLRAGLGISRTDLKKIGGTAIKLSCIPGLIEGMTIAAISTVVLGFSFIQGGLLGFVIAAVSPAVVVPHMLYFMENGIGTKKGIPTLLLAGSSIDDVFAITMFTTFYGFYSGKNINIALQILGVPVSIILGIVLGFIVGLIFVKLFKAKEIHGSKKVLLLLGAAILLNTLQGVVKDRFEIEIAALLGVMAIGFIILEKLPDVAEELSAHYNKIWIFAEILLFVLVGAEVNIGVAFDSGAKGLIIIFLGLIGRSIGVFISTLGTKLNWKERVFCAISYTPKATVQAAMGAVPLALGVKSGDIILAVAVLSILVTAPLGAIGINATAKKLLTTEEKACELVLASEENSSI